MLARVMAGELVSGRPGQLITGVSTDSRIVRPGQIFFALRGENFDGHKFVSQCAGKGASAAVVEKKFRGRVPRGFGLVKVNDVLFALGELAGFVRARRRLKVVGITGSVGKTTVKEMAALALAGRYRVAKSPGNFNNLLGVPLAIFGIGDKAEAAVLELASNRPGEIARLAQIAQPDIGLITKIAPVHLQGLADLNGVETEKRALLSSLGPGGTFIFNLRDERLRRLALGYAGRRIGFGFCAPGLEDVEMQVQSEKVRMAGTAAGLVQKFQVRVSGLMRGSHLIELKGAGEHLIENALGAAAVGLALGVELDELAAALKKFEPMAGRGKLERLKKGIWLLDESYNANPESMRWSLSAFEAYGRFLGGRKILVLGEMAELGDYADEAHEALGRYLRRISFNQLYYLGGFQKQLVSGLGRVAAAKLVIAGDLGEMEKLLLAGVRPGDLVMIKSSHAIGLWRVAEGLRRG